MSSPPKKRVLQSLFFFLLVFSLRTSVCLSAHNSTKEESKHFSTLGGMPVTGWLRGTVKAVPSGDTVLIVANAGPTVRVSCIYIYIYIYMFLGAFVSFFFFFCRGDGVSSLFRDVFSLLFWVP